jgi:hypothetical protein
MRIEDGIMRSTELNEDHSQENGATLQPHTATRRAEVLPIVPTKNGGFLISNV